ncbi:MAG: phosphonate C-P lyase system protein PhnH [Hyphomicrobiaceae bacterium]|nr:phosphonate C-P lyase system protein PhnH [Hyphomicrobiaceae bacterium]
MSAGFADPVHGTQKSFRALLDAMARPGTVVPMPVAVSNAAPLPSAMAAAILTLADHETTIWLDAPLASRPDVAQFLRFATGAKLSTDPREATFALVSDPRHMPAIDAFAAGTPDYPDSSTTILLAVDQLSASSGGTPVDRVSLELSGSGIDGTMGLSFSPAPPRLAEQLGANRARFPMGVDLILCGPGNVAALPRSTKLTGVR